MRKRIAPTHIARFTVAADQNFFPFALCQAATDFRRAAPDKLGVMRHVLWPTGAAVAGEDAGDEMFFLGNP